MRDAHDTGTAVTVDLESPPSRQPWALDLQDEAGPRRLRLDAGTVVLGASRSADFVVHDATVSGRHCAVNMTGGLVTVRDLGSRNGSFIGGARVLEAVVGVGTVVTIGRSTIAFSAIDETEIEEVLGPPIPGLAGNSYPMRRLAARVRRLSCHTAPVLVIGESGTGKELVARALHDEGPRRAYPFVALNVAALPRELVESEMFGHERGAFTGAVARREGAFREAERGSLFLDEIGELPLQAQPKLLRALDGYGVRRVGGAGPGRPPDVRVIAATHVALDEKVESGGFRRDLFHRLEVFLVDVPPLRDRKADIAAIARHLLDQMAHELGARRLTSAAIARLLVHDWPGNVRELRNVLYRASDFATESDVLDVGHVERGFRRPSSPPMRAMLSTAQAHLLLAEHQNNLSAAARAAGYARTTFRKLLEGA